MEVRLGNQQRHSITAVLLSAVVIIFGLVLVDMLSTTEPDPLGVPTEAIEAPSTSADPGRPEADGDLTAGVARSNARFILNPDVTVPELESSTTAARRRTTTTAAVVPTTSNSTKTTDAPSTSAASSTTTTTTEPDPKGKPTTTVDDDETTTTRKCRGNRPGCRNP